MATNGRWADSFQGWDHNAVATKYNASSITGLTIAAAGTALPVGHPANTTEGGAGYACNMTDLTDYLEFELPTTTTSSKLHAAFRVKIGTLVPSIVVQDVWTVWNSANQKQYGLAYHATNQAFLFTGPSGPIGAQYVQVLTDDWYHIEVVIKLQDTFGSAELFIDETQVIDETGISTGTELIKRMRLHCFHEPCYYLDYVVHEPTSGVTDPIGDNVVKLHLPTGAGSHSDHTPGTAAQVDELGLHDGDTTENNNVASSSSHIDTFAMTTLADMETVQFVQMNLAADQDGVPADMKSRFYYYDPVSLSFDLSAEIVPPVGSYGYEYHVQTNNDTDLDNDWFESFDGTHFGYQTFFFES